MTDEPPGDAAFKRWFAEQDPFGNSKEKRPLEQAKPLRRMTDEPSGDAAFERWFAEQDPFGNSKEKRPKEQAKTLQARPPASGPFRLGIVLPVLVVAILVLAFVSGVVLRSLQLH
jgi:hypothetical protein